MSTWAKGLALRISRAECGESRTLGSNREGRGLIPALDSTKFPFLSRQEVEAMLGLDLIRNTRVYQEAFTEGE